MTEDQISKVLAEINQAVPQKWRALLFVTRKKTPTIERVVSAALASDQLEPAKRAELEAILNSGDYSQEQTVLNESMALRIDKFVERRIQHAIKIGKLPSREELVKLPFYKKYAQTPANNKK